MLRIQRYDVDSHEVTLNLQGRMVAVWANLLERECDELIRSGFRVELDVSGVVFIGRSGLEALSRMSRCGVGIIGCSPWVAAMLEQEGIVTVRKSENPNQF